MKLLFSAVSAAALLATGAQAKVEDVQPHGFKSVHVFEVAARPDAVWAALVRPGAWWPSAHSWSGDAKNLTIDPVAGGCFCERWSGGEVRHLTVVRAMPTDMLVLWGALGPLQTEGVAGGLSVALKPQGEGTTVTVTYAVGGYLSGGSEKWAPLVDRVLGAQFGRLGRYVETGKSD